MDIDKIVDQYSSTHKKMGGIALHIPGIVLLYFGVMGLLWVVPNELIVKWAGNNEYAKWSLVLVILMVLVYGSMSFYLTFAIGLFMFGQLVAVEWVFNNYPEYFMQAVVGSVIGGFLLIVASNALEKCLKNTILDLKRVAFGPAWMFGLLLRQLGISL